MDLASHANSPREVTLAGRTFLVSGLTQSEWGAVQAWIKDHVPGPLSVLDAPGFDDLRPQRRKEVMAMAMAEARHWPPRPGSAAWLEALASEDGVNAFVLAVLRKHQPELPEADLAAIGGSITDEEASRLTILALGGDPDAVKSPGPSE